MDAVVLVGGEGTRLRPLTYELPKQLLPVCGKPMLGRVIDHLRSQGATRIVLSLGYRPEAFLEWLRGQEAKDVVAVVEPHLLDTAGALRYASYHGGTGERFIGVNGDVLTDFSASPLLELHEARSALATVGLVEVADASRFGVVAIDQQGMISAFVEKPGPEEAPSRLANAGIYVIEQEALSGIEPGTRVSIEREVFPKLAAAGRLYGAALEGYWVDAGTREAYLRACLDFAAGRAGSLSASVAQAIEEGGLLLGRGASLEGLVEPPVWIGDQAVVERGARVSSSVIESGAHVERYCVLESSVVLTGASVGREARLTGTLVGGGARIGPGARLQDCIVGFGAEVPPRLEAEGRQLA
jgi:mannose-1-phosphate guanylyltransferase